MTMSYALPGGKMMQAFYFRFYIGTVLRYASFTWNSVLQRWMLDILDSSMVAISTGKVVSTEMVYRIDGISIVFKNASRSYTYPGLEDISSLRMYVDG